MDINRFTIVLHPSPNPSRATSVCTFNFYLFFVTFFILILTTKVRSSDPLHRCLKKNNTSSSNLRTCVHFPTHNQKKNHPSKSAAVCWAGCTWMASSAREKCSSIAAAGLPRDPPEVSSARSSAQSSSSPWQPSSEKKRRSLGSLIGVCAGGLAPLLLFFFLLLFCELWHSDARAGMVCDCVCGE